MNMDEMHARVSEILLRQQKQIWLKVAGMVGRCWMTKEINDKLMEREDVRRSEGIHTDAYKSLNEEVSRLTTEVKRRIWQRKVLVKRNQ